MGTAKDYIAYITQYQTVFGHDHGVYGKKTDTRYTVTNRYRGDMNQVEYI